MRLRFPSDLYCWSPHVCIGSLRFMLKSLHGLRDCSVRGSAGELLLRHVLSAPPQPTIVAISPRTFPPSTLSLPTHTGSLNLRGPALPGLKQSTPPRVSCLGT